MIRVIGVAVAAALLLAGCASVPSSVAGTCQVFQDPGFRVRGVTTRDQRWIASTQETGIQVCHWKRPARMQYAPDCATTRQVVAAFGSAEAAEAYAITQGATAAQIAKARACLAPQAAAPAVKRPGFVKRTWQRIRGKSAT